MYKSSIVIGSPSITDGNTQDLAFLVSRLGGNSGNMLFTESILRNIAGSRFHHGEIPADADSVIIAAANWLNPGDDFGWLADRLEKINLPVSIIGIGAQTGTDKKIPRVEAGTIRLLKLVAERSKLISTRGQFSSEVLEHYGIKNSVPTGCPSMLMCSPDGPKLRLCALGEGVVMHGTRHADHKTTAFQSYIYNQALKRDFDLLLQSESTDLIISRCDAPFDISGDAAHAVGVTYKSSDYAAVVRYLRKRAKFFHNLEAWTSYAGSKEFFVGTRIHGTVAALIAGTPALLVAHDSRTIELAQTMSIPYVRADDIDLSRDLDIDALFEIARAFDFPRYKFYRDGFRSFFESNGIPHQ